MAVTLRSYSKVNLGLRIGPARADGFHALATVYQTLDLHDLVTVELERGAGGLMLSCTDRRVPLDGRNTVAKMLTRALAGRPGIEVRVHIEKRLPVQGGMGAGSANAAAALLGVEAELARLGWAAPLDEAERLRLAAQVGSDVPLFLLGGSVLGQGRGELVEELGDLPPRPVVVALPNTGVSTPAAFRAWDAQQTLTFEDQAGRLEQFTHAVRSTWAGQADTGIPSPVDGGLAGGDPLAALVQTGLCTNDFEQVVFRQNPFLGQLKRAFVESQAVYAALSGSGSAVFGVFAESSQAEAADRKLRARNVRTLRGRLLNRAAYRTGMVV